MLKSIAPIVPILIGLFVLVGWVFELIIVKSGRLPLVPINPTEAALLVVAGVTVSCLVVSERRAALARMAKAGALLLVFVGLVKVMDIPLNQNIAIDTWVFGYSRIGYLGAGSRLGPHTAFCFVLIGVATGLMDRRQQVISRLFVRTAQAAAVIAAFIAVLALVGKAYGVATFRLTGPYEPMSGPTAISILCLSLTLMLIYPDKAITGLIADKNLAGWTIRRLLPVAVILPIVIGWLRLKGQQAGFYTDEVGTAMFAMTTVVTISAIVFWTARQIRVRDARRAKDLAETRRVELHDLLTGLPNRALFLELLAARFALGARHTQTPFAVFALNLDGFRHVNDRLGHDAADRLLVEVGDVLKKCVRTSDVVGRLGGDTFAILLEEIADPADVAILADRILASVPKSYSRNATTVPVGISIGIALKSERLATPEMMLHDAEIALARAKASGKSRYDVAKSDRTMASPPGIQLGIYPRKGPI
jgi:diguanylate cyclase (GGDEF)-like protein